jgi:putative spermidine/putrescine transport system substrate-binding protein
VKDVPLTLAPQKSQDVIKEFGRAEYADWIAKHPHAQPLEDKALVAAFKKWDQEIGGQRSGALSGNQITSKPAVRA